MKNLESIRRTDGALVTLGVVENDDTGARCYYMSGPTGRHELAVSETDEKRLAAHWSGFCQMNDVENRAAREAKAGPNKVKSSHACETEANRCRYLVALIESRIESLETWAGRLDADWGHAGDAEHLRQQLVAICAPDDDGSLLESIDAELNGEDEGDESDELGLAEFDRVQTS